MVVVVVVVVVLDSVGRKPTLNVASQVRRASHPIPCFLSVLVLSREVDFSGSEASPPPFVVLVWFPLRGSWFSSDKV